MDQIILSTMVAGMYMKTPLMNASGCWSSSYDQLDEIGASSAGAIVSKSCTLKPREGNSNKFIYIEKDFGSVNYLGNPNRGYDYYNRYEGSRKYQKPYILSFYPFSPEELLQITPARPSNEELAEPAKSTAVELNLSCPNIGTGFDFETFDRYIDVLRTFETFTQPWGIKLPPFIHRYELNIIQNMIMKTNAIKFITATNTIPNGVIYNDKEKCLIGGVGGRYLKPIALSNVVSYAGYFGDRIDIIGCGGINSSKDVMTYLQCGAKAVQIGTELIKTDPIIFGIIEQDLISLFNKRKSKL